MHRTNIVLTSLAIINLPMYFLYYEFWVLNSGGGNESWGEEEKEEEERKWSHW